MEFSVDDDEVELTLMGGDEESRPTTKKTSEGNQTRWVVGLIIILVLMASAVGIYFYMGKHSISPRVGAMIYAATHEQEPETALKRFMNVLTFEFLPSKYREKGPWFYMGIAICSYLVVLWRMKISHLPGVSKLVMNIGWALSFVVHYWIMRYQIITLIYVPKEREDMKITIAILILFVQYLGWFIAIPVWSWLVSKKWFKTSTAILSTLFLTILGIYVAVILVTELQPRSVAWRLDKTVFVMAIFPPLIQLGWLITLIVYNAKAIKNDSQKI